MSKDVHAVQDVGRQIVSLAGSPEDVVSNDESHDTNDPFLPFLEEHDESGMSAEIAVPLLDDPDANDQDQPEVDEDQSDEQSENGEPSDDPDDPDPDPDGSWNGSDEDDHDQGYYSMLQDIAEKWMLVELNHTVSKAASNAFWDIATSLVPTLFQTKQALGVTRKTCLLYTSDAADE